MSNNFFTPIVNGDSRKNDAAIWNDPLGQIDSQLTSNSSELVAARDGHATLAARLDAMVLAGSNVATLTSGAQGSSTTLTVDSTTGFIAGGRIAFTNADGDIEYRLIDTIVGATSLTVTEAHTGVSDNALVTMISESEYQASQATQYGGLATQTLPSVIARLEREVNAKSFGAYGDGDSHLIDGVGQITLAEAKAAFPLTAAYFRNETADDGIDTGDEVDWCAIQEAILTADAAESVEEVYIPKGTYKINRSLVIPLNEDAEGRTITIKGAGWRASTESGTLLFASAECTLLVVPGLTHICDLALRGTDTTDTNMIAIRIGAKQQTTTASGNQTTSTTLVVASTSGFTAGHRITYTNSSDVVEERIIDTVTDATHLELTVAHSGVFDTETITQITRDNPYTNMNSVHVLIERVYFAGDVNYGVYGQYECDMLEIAHCVFARGYGTAGIYLTNNYNQNNVSPSAGMVFRQLQMFSGGDVQGETKYGIYLFGTENCAIRNCIINGFDHAIYLHGASGGVRNHGLQIEGVHSEWNSELAGSARWQPNKAYTLLDGNGDPVLIRPMSAAANGWWYKCTTAGTSANTSLVSASYKWTASTSGTNEYYLEAAAGGDPSISALIANLHGLCQLVSGTVTQLTRSWPGRLTAGQWGYGNNDSLLFNTIYVRLSNSADPDSHNVWVSSQEPTWPTTYGGTVTDGTVVWTAYKRSVFLELANVDDCVAGGLDIRSVYAEGFAAFIYNAQNTTMNMTVSACTVTGCDMVYRHAFAIRHEVEFVNSALDGCIRPYTALTASNLAGVIVRGCTITNDLINLFIVDKNGASNFFMGWLNYGRTAGLIVNDASTYIDPVNHNNIVVQTGSGATAVTLTMSRLIHTAYLSAFRGKQITITHLSGSDGLTLAFFSAEGVIYNGTENNTSISLPDIGDSVTLQFVLNSGGSGRWAVVGSHGI